MKLPWSACTGDDPSVVGSTGQRFFPHVHIGPSTNSDGEHRAGIIVHGGHTIEECDEIARLFAAAWEMREVLRQLDSMLPNEECSDRDLHMYKLVSGMLARLP